MKTEISDNLLNDPAVQGANIPKHTLGPWAVEPARSPIGRPAIELEVVAGIRHVAQVQLFEDEDSANARLIAAAPELLEALKAALPQLVWVSKHSESNCPDSTLKQAQAAIAKAERAKETGR